MFLQGEVLELNVVLPDLKVNSRELVLQAISREASIVTGITEKHIFDKLMIREHSETSGVGGGVAIPHMYARGLDKSFMLFARLGLMVDFNALDGKPVDLVFFVLSPDADGPIHLRRLARVSRVMRDEVLQEQLRGTNDIDTLFSLIQNPAHRNMAA